MATEFRSAVDGAANAAGGTIVNPIELDGSGAIANEPPASVRTRKPRSDAGKPRGTRTGTTEKKAKVPLDLSALAGMLAGATASFAAMKEIPEFEISEEESIEFMQKAQAVLRHYAVETTQKGVDFIALFGISFSIVSTRVAAYSLRMKSEKRSAQNDNDPTHNFHNGPYVIDGQLHN